VRSPARLIDRHGLRELGLVGIGLLIYYLVRGFVADELPEARTHALAIIHLEQNLHVFWEPQIQHLLNRGIAEIQFWNLVYFWAHAPVIAAVGVWLYLRDRRRYSLIRNAFLVSALIGLVIYWLVPVAPPRLLSGFGFVDTMQRYSGLSYQAQSLRPFVNPYAAVPSLHFGWSLLIGVGLILAVGRTLGWVLGIVLPLLMLIAIVATANHFFFDAAAGLVVCLIGLLAAAAVQRWQASRERPATRQAERHDVSEPATV
jgi:hypothetical protein